MQSITIIVKYAPVLECITGKSEEKMVVNEGILFLMFLHFVFTSYPKLMERYAPGVLGFTINGIPPKNSTILQDKDVVVFKVN